MEGWSFDRARRHPGLRCPAGGRLLVAALTIAAPPERVFDIVDLEDGQEQDWHRADVTVRLVHPATRTYRIRYVVMQGTDERVSHADFRVVERDAPHHLAQRAGIEDHLAAQPAAEDYERTSSVNGGAYVDHGLSRGALLVAQFTSRGDLLGGLYRIKGLAETGKPNLAADTVISLAIALGHRHPTLAAFAWWLDNSNRRSSSSPPCSSMSSADPHGPSG